MKSAPYTRTAADENPPVLHNRRVRPDYPPHKMSRLEDMVWDLSGGVFEEHGTKLSINFAGFSDHWRLHLQRWLWTLINVEDVALVPGARAGRPSLQTVVLIKGDLLRLFAVLDTAGVRNLDALDSEALDALVIYLIENESYEAGRRILTEVRRLWVNRHLVEAPLRMRPAVPWNGDRAADLLKLPPSTSGAKTKRVGDATLVPLMTWATRFVTEYSDDIIQSYRQYCSLIRNEYRHRPEDELGTLTRHSVPVAQRLSETLEELRDLGLGIPGQAGRDGVRTIRWPHLARLAKVQAQWAEIYHREMVEAAGLSIDDDAYLTVQCTGLLDGSPWRPRPIPWDEAIDYVTLLQTACFILISYLSGMRPGEVLNLRRGCASFDGELGLWKVQGRRWKSALTATGEKIPEGEDRDAPWVVHALAAEAISVLQDLHTSDLLFPNQLRPQPLRGFTADESARSGLARTSSQMGADFIQFTEWVNGYVSRTGRSDPIPEDPGGRLNARRLRRTLAWHIVRRPRGLVAAAIQYGHLSTLITQGYAGNRASGFPDELAFERWLERFEHLSEIDSYSQHGGRVSGPAAGELQRRAASAVDRFAGRTVPTFRQASAMLKRPDMQVHQGKGMHCVFNAATALCLRDSDGPNLGDCRSACTNIARTDEDVDALADLRERLSTDTLAPPIRHRRNLEIIDKLTGMIDIHEKGPTP